MNDWQESENMERIPIVKNLKRYLETEILLNVFFNTFDYCMEKCIAVEIERNKGRPVSACCKDRYHCISDLDHPAFSLLRHEREILYGNPEDQVNPDPVSPCEYHGLRGCCLPTHKSPICLSFMCRKSIDFLRLTYGIYTYDYLGVYYALEWILTGDFSDASYREFRESIVVMTQRINEHEVSKSRS
jgi:hypothetical protein